MKKKLVFVGAIVIFSSVFYSCNEEDPIPEPDFVEIQATGDDDDDDDIPPPALGG